MMSLSSRTSDAGLADAHAAVAEMAALAGGLAHELRNPLSTIMITLKLLGEELQSIEQDPQGGRRRALLKVETLRREAERLQALFDDFLNLTGPYSLQRRRVDLNDVVRRLAEFCEPLLTAGRVRVRVDTAPGAVTCDADEKLLSQALLNLIMNAQQAMPAGGTLTLATQRGDAAVGIVVSDTGVGIAPPDRERILRPFFSTKSGGTGLGLSITRRIIHEHGGFLTFESVPGGGTTFTISLPPASGRPTTES